MVEFEKVVESINTRPNEIKAASDAAAVETLLFYDNYIREQRVLIELERLFSLMKARSIPVIISTLDVVDGYNPNHHFPNNPFRPDVPDRFIIPSLKYIFESWQYIGRLFEDNRALGHFPSVQGLLQVWYGKFVCLPGADGIRVEAILATKDEEGNLVEK